MLDVVAAMICREDGKILLCRRPAHKARGLCWEFPGGKVEAGETGERALAREISEELGAEIAVDERVAETEHAYPDVRIRLSLWRAHVVSGTPTALEHAEIRWIDPAEAPSYELCPADRQLLARIGGNPS